MIIKRFNKKDKNIDLEKYCGIPNDRTEMDEVLNALNDKEKIVIVGTAPSVRVALGEEFGYEIGTIVKGKMVTALKKIGFNKVFDINFAADLTIMEEGSEFVKRLNNKKLPMFTSCCPGWVKYVEQNYPDMLDNLSTCKSPQQMFGAVIKTYYAKINNIDPKNIFVVTAMPCIVKKLEKERENINASAYKDIDAVISTRELAILIKMMGIDFNNLEDSEFDTPFGFGASVIFGATGGVMETALRNVYEIMNREKLKKIDFKEVRGSKGVKEATIVINKKMIKIAVISGLGNAKTVLDSIKKGKKYDFIEVMTCPNGCVNGAGQPIHEVDEKGKMNIAEKRRKAIYKEESNLDIKKANENPFIKKIYDDYLEEPGSKKAEEILHVKYSNNK